MEKKAYFPTSPDIEWVAGQRVQRDSSGAAEPLMLTDAQAEPELARGIIQQAMPEDATSTRRKAREG